ncbi:MAG: hypothetical protein JWO90_311 [Solirubrobacterales bacterium]|nr:hypothetical protein [Solirubrobacterales bacterium]
MGGRETLEVVGESFCQEALWHIVGGRCADRVRCSVEASLVPEPTNPYDSNAVRVYVEGFPVGYLSREDAAAYLPGLHALAGQHGRHIGLRGAVVGGGRRGDGIGLLGVFLDHDPADFGLAATRQASQIPQLRTGLAQALATDHEDDSYDLSWLDRLSANGGPSDIPKLRGLLLDETDPIDRHFMFCELEHRLYKSRDAFASALEEFDAACAQHHDEMTAIRPALLDKFGAVPVIEMYRQAAIRFQKARAWEQARLWAEHGLTVYGADAARPEAVEDLLKRAAYATAKAAGPTPRAPRPPAGTGSGTEALEAVEVLVCVACDVRFERVRTRGRKPLRCPDCRDPAAT